MNRKQIKLLRIRRANRTRLALPELWAKYKHIPVGYRKHYVEKHYGEMLAAMPTPPEDPSYMEYSRYWMEESK